MKNKIGLFLSILCVILVTGCVNYNVSMHINKDKSMEYSIIFMMNPEVYSKTDIRNELEIIKFNGFDVEEYTNGVFRGYRFTTTIEDIDDYSENSDVVYTLSEPPSANYIFKVKKGYFKNKYTANFVFDKSLFNSNEPKKNDKDLETYIEQNDNGLLDQDVFFDAEKTVIKFSAVLPYPALSNNATAALDNNKNLVWNITDDVTNISFEFELYNIAELIFIHVVMALVVVAIAVIQIIRRMKPTKGVKKMDIDVDTVLENTQEMIQGLPPQSSQVSPTSSNQVNTMQSQIQNNNMENKN